MRLALPWQAPSVEKIRHQTLTAFLLFAYVPRLQLATLRSTCNYHAVVALKIGKFTAVTRKSRAICRHDREMAQSVR